MTPENVSKFIKNLRKKKKFNSKKISGRTRRYLSSGK